MHRMQPNRALAATAWRAAEHAFDAPFGGALNPLKHLGALAFLMFWLLAASGIVLYIVLDTSAAGAYRSIDELSRQPLGAGSLLRGLHRYAADAFVLLTIAHLAREWMLGRFNGFRRYSWLTGVPLLVFAYVCGIGGFWLNWDRLGQFSATATAEWLDALPLFASPLSRNFLVGASVADRLFSLFVFVHLGVPLLLLFGLWFHLQRLSRADVWPPRALALATTGVLLALAAAVPVVSQGPADLRMVASPVALDWFLLFIHPLAAATSSGFAWASVGAVLLLLFGLPFAWPRAAVPVAQVDPANCNGCRRCVEDCPYAAITMVPHPRGRRLQLAEVRPELCASCGICAGACPSSTPFRGGEPLRTGIDMPQWPVDALRRRLVQGLAALTGERRFVVFGCDQGASAATLAAHDVLPLSLVCTGMLPPSFVEYALRGGADGVLIAGCREGGCAFRLGARWTAQRLQGTREPRLRESAAGRWQTVWADAGDEAALRTALARLRAQLGAQARLEPIAPPEGAP